MCLPPNQTSLFIGDIKGNLYQVCLKTERFLKKIGQISKGMIQTIVITSDQKFLFAADRLGSLLQICLSIYKILKNYKENTAFGSRVEPKLLLTFDTKNL
jgi:hypothetical protein